MIKTLAVTLLATVAMIGAAQADDEMDAYTTCWADVAGRGTENAVTEADTYLLQNAVASASKECMELALEAVKTNGLEDVKAMADYMEVQFYNGHLREKGEHVTAAKPERKIRKVSSQSLDVSYVASNQYGPGFRVSRNEYGDRWPYFRFNAAIIRCHPHPQNGRPLVTIQYDGGGAYYGLNGAAMGVGGFPDPRPFLVRNEDGSLRTPIPSDWIRRGVKLCG